MIKIDGEKIKQLRESQGLTQLYMATAVAVTTDTISRWENKRYPSVKKENALKVAETLGVSLEEILLVEDYEEDEEHLHKAEKDAKGKKAPSHADETQPKETRRYILLAVAVLLSSLFASLIYFLKPTPSIQKDIKARRIMPQSAIPNTPFPVVIEVQHQGNIPVSIILKEQLPLGSEVIERAPSPGSSVAEGEAKWLHKLQSTTRFSYLVKIPGTQNDEFRFNGNLATSQNGTMVNVEGSNIIRLGTHHWADVNKDNKISDQEILTVFDYYSGIDGFTIDIEFIEKMWLGSKYSWDSKKNKITIIP